MSEGGRGPSREMKCLGIVRILAIFSLLAWVLGGPKNAAAAQVRGERPGGLAQVTEPTLDFDAAVQIGLKQSPYLVKSTLEIDVRRLDEADSRSAFIPTVTFRTRYYVNHPTQVGFNPRPYVLEFVTDGYNPVEAYFSLQAQKLLTKIAILAHHLVISKGLEVLGGKFLELETLQRLAAVQENLINLSQKNLAYLRERLKLGETTSLEVQLASQELELAQIEKERIISSQARLKDMVKSYLGLGPDRKIDFDLKQARHQVMGSFDPEAASLDEARSRSFERKIQVLKKELQALKVLMAKARILPTFFAGVQNPDPLSAVNDRGFFFSLGLSWPVWEGFRRMRDITRQKTILRQYDAELEEKDLDQSKDWGEARENFLAARAALKLTQTQVEVALLKERQSEIRYRTEGEPFASLATGRRGSLEAQKNSLVKALESDRARLHIRYLAGDLIYHYVDESSWKN
jgi:outer membrane protein TolC